MPGNPAGFTHSLQVWNGRAAEIYGFVFTVYHYLGFIGIEYIFLIVDGFNQGSNLNTFAAKTFFYLLQLFNLNKRFVSLNIYYNLERLPGLVADGLNCLGATVCSTPVFFRSHHHLAAKT